MPGRPLTFLLACLLAASAAPAFGIGPVGALFNRNPKIDPARVRQLAELVRTEPDEKKRRAALTELATADPRVHPEVIPALTGVLQRDSSPALRAAAAETIGRMNVVFPVAGLALEAAAAGDPIPAVRDAARQALWDYHLSGYRSAKGADGFAGQTAEPPLAPARPRVPVIAEPPAAVAPVVAARPPVVDTLPPVGPPPGPRVSLLAKMTGPRTILSSVPPHPNLTAEPPIARPAVRVVVLPTTPPEPPIRPHWPEPVRVVKPPPLALDLPPIVTPPDGPPRRPDAIPGVPLPK